MFYVIHLRRIGSTKGHIMASVHISINLCQLSPPPLCVCRHGFYSGGSEMFWVEIILGHSIDLSHEQ